MPKKILIVEAGTEYLKRHLIEATKQLPYEFYLLQTKFFDGSNNWVQDWFSPARIIHVDSMDAETIYAKVTEYCIVNNIVFNGALTFWEGYVPITNYLQTKLKLPQICSGDIRSLRHKGMMRNSASRSLMKQPKYNILRGNEDVDDVLREASYPLIVKPAEMAASIAVRKVHNQAELCEAVVMAHSTDYAGYVHSYKEAFNLSSDIMIEEYINCDYEISVEGAVYNGELNIIAICQKIPPPEPYFWEYGEITPAPNVDKAMSQKLRRELQSVITCLQLNNCIVHAEIRVVNGIFYFIEMGARIGGYAIPEIVFLSTGINLLSLAAPLSCGDRPTTIDNIKISNCAGDYSFNTVHSPIENGVAFLVNKLDMIKNIPGVVTANVRSEVEDTIYGDMIATADSNDNLSKCIETAKQMLLR